MTNQYSAKHYAKKAQKWAVGTSQECPDGSAKHWADDARQTAQSIGDPANRDLSNLTSSGLAMFDAKQDTLTAGDNIQIDTDGTISALGGALPLFAQLKTGHVLNNASFVNAGLFSWLSGSIYTSAYQTLVNEMNAGKKAFYKLSLNSTGDVFLLSHAPSVGDMAYTIQNGYAIEKSKISNIGYAELGSVMEVTLEDGAMYQRSVGSTSVDLEAYLVRSVTFDNVTVLYYLTDTNKKICLADQQDALIELYNATGAADFYLLDTQNDFFKLPRRHKRRLIKGFKQGYEWYNLYSDGWCEQGGLCVVANNEIKTINLKQIYQDTNYNILLTQGLTNGAYYQGRHPIVINDSIATSSFKMENARFSGDTTSASKIYWRTSGYANTSLLQDEFEYDYYFVGQTVQSQTTIDVGTLSETFNSKADVDLANAAPSSDFKRQVLSWLTPDYTAGITLPVGSVFTAPADGYLNCADARSATGSGTIKVSVNGVNVRIWEWQGNYAANTFQYRVGKNDTVLITVIDAAFTGVFYPLKGWGDD